MCVCVCVAVTGWQGHARGVCGRDAVWDLKNVDGSTPQKNSQRGPRPGSLGVFPSYLVSLVITLYIIHYTPLMEQTSEGGGIADTSSVGARMCQLTE